MRATHPVDLSPTANRSNSPSLPPKPAVHPPAPKPRNPPAHPFPSHRGSYGCRRRHLSLPDPLHPQPDAARLHGGDRLQRLLDTSLHSHHRRSHHRADALAVSGLWPNMSSLIAATRGLQELSPLKPITKMMAASVSLGTGASLGRKPPASKSALILECCWLKFCSSRQNGSACSWAPGLLQAYLRGLTLPSPECSLP